MGTPIRTCVGCRQRELQNKLIRIVLSENRAIPATDSAVPGRGAYLHPNPECINAAVSRKLLSRALKAQSNLDISDVLNLINTKKP